MNWLCLETNCHSKNGQRDTDYGILMIHKEGPMTPRNLSVKFEDHDDGNPMDAKDYIEEDSATLDADEGVKVLSGKNGV